ncbi:MAG: glycosyltransferase [Bacteroidota bacterium]
MTAAMIPPEKKTSPINKYLKRHWPEYRIDENPDPDLGIIVVIPAYREGSLLFRTLDSIAHSHPPSFPVEVIIVLNASEIDSPEVRTEQEVCSKDIEQYTARGLPSWLTIHHIQAYNLRKKHAGAGLARKIGLDEGTRRFSLLDHPEGILACLDADSPVAPNYFTAIEKWAANPDHMGAIVRFEHALEGNEYPPAVYEGIILYELHLRYYLLGLRITGFPHAFHTIGSCMVFRASAYTRAGGMPRKQAGEDFYFLQKLIPLGGFSEITDTIVYPSPRPSHRVIFGTGASIQKHLEGTEKQGTTYNPQVFSDLRVFFTLAGELFKLNPEAFESWTYKLNGPLRSFLLNSNFEEEWIDLRKNCKSKNAFLKRLFHVFNAFRVIKYIHYAHEYFYAKSDLFDAAIKLLEEKGRDASDIFDEKELLKAYRVMEIEASGF